MTTAPRRLRRSRVLEALRAGRSATCFKLNLSDARVAEIVAMEGVDAIWLCQEHVPSDWINLEHQIRAARLHDADAFVRVAKGGYSNYVRPFEAGAAGIMVPHVTTADEARQIVEWARFMPVGRRALDGGNTEGAYCSVPTGDYIAHTLREQFVVLQIESPEGLANVEEIAAVPGFDLFCFGPGDYAHRVGKPGQVSDPEVVEARQRVARAARAHGKWAMAAGMLAPRAALEQEGHALFSLGADVIAVAEGARRAVKNFHEAG
jgi:4-hydroxy-2-oxoheptanedioate aldolase